MNKLLRLFLNVFHVFALVVVVIVVVVVVVVVILVVIVVVVDVVDVVVVVVDGGDLDPVLGWHGSTRRTKHGDLRILRQPLPLQHTESQKIRLKAASIICL